MAERPTTEEVQRRRHNEKLLADLEPGDLIEFPRGGYSHWAVYVGDGNVVHLSGDGNNSISTQSGTGQLTITGSASVKVENFWNVVDGSWAQRNNSKDEEYPPLPKREIVQRANGCVGNVKYNILVQNCEHFATWCRYNKKESEQADTILKRLMTAGITGAVALIISMIIYNFLKSSSKRKS